jgi:eukaryotic-like serine/threonine-protein kinase
MNPLPFGSLGDADAPPVLAGKYRLVRPLGAGGMGAVWVARNIATDAEVALKVVLEGDESSELVERLRREAHATARLSHRSIVRIYDMIELGDTGDRVAVVMELLHGRTLGDHLHERETLPVAEAVAITLPLLSALAHAHARGVVHRDLKPENVFLSVDPDGIVTPKILDFGISKVRVPGKRNITQHGELLGTPSYMSPEQTRGLESVDGRSDLFNIGILLYEMLSGTNPFVGEGLQKTMQCVLDHEPPRIAGLPAPLWHVIERALSKSPADRFADAGELAAALRLAVGLPEATNPSRHPSFTDELAPELALSAAPLPPPPAPARRTWKLFAAAAGASLAAAAVAATLALWTTGAIAGPAAVTSLAHAAFAPVHVAALDAPATAEQNDLARQGTSVRTTQAATAHREAPAHVRHVRAGVAATSAVAPTPARVPSSNARFLARDPGF